MNSEEIRKRFLNFFEKRGHKIIPSSSMVPENDPTTLFTGSGMQPMIPYLLGETHPLGTRIANCQRCFRTDDIKEVGDNRHTTYFEMLGNWSFGDYWKEEQITWIYEFLINEIGIDKSKFWVSCFEGDPEFNLPKDEKSPEIWKRLGMPEEKIVFYPSRKNWWSRSGGNPDKMPPGEPGGPDTEMFYDFGADLKLHENSQWSKERCHLNCDCGRFMEIGNNVFMQYKKVDGQNFELLPRKNVDFGGGLERITAATNNDPDVFNLDIFEILKEKLEKDSNKKYTDPFYTRSFRIVMDHVRASNALIQDGVMPSNTERGYVLRRLLRRAIVHAGKIGIPEGNLFTDEVANVEEQRFRKTLERGMHEFEKGERDAFLLFTTYGFPLELTLELAKERGIEIDVKNFEEKFKKHQKESRTSSAGRFKGGLADTSEKTVRLHTAHHLLLASLQKILGSEVKQRGSNITSERLRIDFSFGRKMTEEEKWQVEDLVNQKISEKLPVVRKEMSKIEAEKIGAEMEFGVKYADRVSVYFIEEKDSSYFSKEFCGGPHVKNTGELGDPATPPWPRFKILKEEASSAGVRRIKAVLE